MTFSLFLSLQCLTTAIGTIFCRGTSPWVEMRANCIRCCLRTSGKWPNSCEYVCLRWTWSTWSVTTWSRPFTRTSVTSRLLIQGETSSTSSGSIEMDIKLLPLNACKMHIILCQHCHWTCKQGEIQNLFLACLVIVHDKVVFVILTGTLF